MLLNA